MTTFFSVPQNSLEGVHGFAQKLMNTGAPVLLAGYQDDVAGVVMNMQRHCQYGNSLCSYPIDLWCPSDDYGAVYRYKRKALCILSVVQPKFKVIIPVLFFFVVYHCHDKLRAISST